MNLRTFHYRLIFLFSFSIFGFSLDNKDINIRLNYPPMVYVIGDSHAGEFVGIPHCHCLEIGQITMHRIGRDVLNCVNLPITLRKYPFEDGDVVVFALGQIDVGWNILKVKYKQNRDLDEIIETLAVNYINALKIICKPYPNTLPIVYSITPPTNNDYTPPYVGTLEERIVVTKRLNNLLQKLCYNNSIEFLDVYDDYADEIGALKLELSDGNHHIANDCKLMIQNRLFNILNKYLK